MASTVVTKKPVTLGGTTCAPSRTIESEVQTPTSQTSASWSGAVTMWKTSPRSSSADENRRSAQRAALAGAIENVRSMLDTFPALSRTDTFSVPLVTPVSGFVKTHSYTP